RAAEHGEVPRREGETIGRGSAARPAESVRTPNCAPRRCRGSWSVDRKRRRRVLENRSHLVTEIDAGSVFSVTDTIVAIATPSGRGGIGVIRVSGPDAASIAHRLITHQGSLDPRYATRTKVRLTTSGRSDDGPPTPIRNTPATDAFDHVVAIYFP